MTAFFMNMFLHTQSIPNIGAQSPYDYSIQPVSLNIVKRPIPATQKFVSVMEKAKAAEKTEALAKASPSYTDPSLIRTAGRSYYISSSGGGNEGASHIGIGRLAAYDSEQRKAILRDHDDRLSEFLKTKAQQQQQQKYASAASTAPSNEEYSQWTIHDIKGVVPIRELLASVGLESLLHESVKEDRGSSYTNHRSDGSVFEHKQFVPANCGNPPCGLCYNHVMQAQKVASSSSGTSNSTNSNYTADRFTQFVPKYQRMRYRSLYAD